MEHADIIIGHLAKDGKISQRQLAKLSDLSLGQLNLILHSLVEKGFIKIDKLNTRNMRYVLTPKGIARNAGRTYLFIRNAFRQVLLLKTELEKVFEQYVAKGYTVYIDGEKDEIYQILQQITSEYKTVRIIWTGGVCEMTEQDRKCVVLVWQVEKEETYRASGVEYINLLNRIDNI